ncbi:MAG: hypothetical protein JWN57_516, partial [Frankiales bacterium]|nr:hypothetical protein [Frankiales bacterium]
AAGTDPRRVYASSPTDVWRSDDGGSTFRALPRPWTSPAVSTRLTVDPTDPDVVHLARWRAPDGGLLRFDGTRWARLSADPLAYDVAVDPADPQRLVLARNDHPYHDVARGGVRLSTDGGRTFRDLGAELPMQRASAVAFDPHTPGRVVVGLYGGGFWSRQLPAGQAATRVAPISVSSASSRFAR